MSSNPSQSAGSSQNLPALVGGNTAFAVDLFHQLRGTSGSLFFAPYSISTALAMTYAGAREQTAAQMAAALHFTLPPDELHATFGALQARLNALQQSGRVSLHAANSLWPREGYPLLADFLALCARSYAASIKPVDFRDAVAAGRLINAWVAENTGNKIKDLLSPIFVSPDTTLILVNAIYFKGAWARPFNPALTREEAFWLSPGTTTVVPMMRQSLSCGYAVLDDLQLLELPYGDPYGSGPDLSFVVLLPARKGRLTELEQQLTPATLTTWLGALNPRLVDVRLPRFTLTSEFELGDTLRHLGLRDAFSAAADFSGMSSRRDLYISAVVHKAFVEVNEEGTEAAAATGVIIGRASFEQPPTFHADHPFLFLIRDRGTGTILFLGRLSDPRQQ